MTIGTRIMDVVYTLSIDTKIDNLSDDLDLLYGISQIWGPTTAKRMKIGPRCQGGIV